MRVIRKYKFYNSLQFYVCNTYYFILLELWAFCSWTKKSSDIDMWIWIGIDMQLWWIPCRLCSCPLIRFWNGKILSQKMGEKRVNDWRRNKHLDYESITCVTKKSHGWNILLQSLSIIEAYRKGFTYLVCHLSLFLCFPFMILYSLSFWHFHSPFSHWFFYAITYLFVHVYINFVMRIIIRSGSW